MSFKINNSARVGNIKSYGSVSNLAKKTFEEQFYSDTSNVKYGQNYEEIDYNAIDLQSGMAEAEKERLEEIKRQEEERRRKEEEARRAAEAAKPWYERAWDCVVDIATDVKDYGVTIGASVVCGALEVVENVGDGLIMAGGAAVSGIASLTGNEEFANSAKEWTKNVVQYDWTEAAYQGIVDLADVDEDIANGDLHKYSSMVGTAAGYIAVSCIPGGAAVTATVGAFAAMGAASEQALNNGADFDQALKVGVVAGVAGAVTGGTLNKVRGAAAGVTSMSGVAGYTLLGAATTAAEPVVNSVAQYEIYAKDLVDENGNPLYDNGWDYYVDSGGLKSTLIAGGIGGISSGLKAGKAYKNYNKLVSSEKFSAFSESVEKKLTDDTIYDTSKKMGIDKSKVELTDSEKLLIAEEAKTKSLKIAKEINKMTESGYVKKGLTNEDVFDLLTNGENQETVFKEGFVKQYYSKWNADADGNVEVVSLKPKNKYEQFVSEKGIIGRSDGEFVLPKKEADAIIKRCTVNGKIDTNKLCKELQLPTGTFDSGVVSVTQKVKITDVKMPNSNLEGSMLGEWLPGGKTGGGNTEGVVGQIKQKGNNATGDFYRKSGRKIKVVIDDIK